MKDGAFLTMNLVIAFCLCFSYNQAAPQQATSPVYGRGGLGISASTKVSSETGVRSAAGVFGTGAENGTGGIGITVEGYNKADAESALDAGINGEQYPVPMYPPFNPTADFRPEPMIETELSTGVDMISPEAIHPRPPFPAPLPTLPTLKPLPMPTLPPPLPIPIPKPLPPMAPLPPPLPIPIPQPLPPMAPLPPPLAIPTLKPLQWPTPISPPPPMMVPNSMAQPPPASMLPSAPATILSPTDPQGQVMTSQMFPPGQILMMPQGQSMPSYIGMPTQWSQPPAAGQDQWMKPSIEGSIGYWVQSPSNGAQFYWMQQYPPGQYMPFQPGQNAMTFVPYPQDGQQQMTSPEDTKE